MKRSLGFQERKAVVNSFVLSNFNYCTLDGCLQVLSPLLKSKTYNKDNLDSCLVITQVPTKEYWKNPVYFPWTLKENIKLYIEIYKTLSNLNPSFMKEKKSLNIDYVPDL